MEKQFWINLNNLSVERAIKDTAVFLYLALDPVFRQSVFNNENNFGDGSFFFVEFKTGFF